MKLLVDQPPTYEKMKETYTQQFRVSKVQFCTFIAPSPSPFPAPHAKNHVISFYLPQIANNVKSFEGVFCVIIRFSLQ